jgi:hypothetical protein
VTTISANWLLPACAASPDAACGAADCAITGVLPSARTATDVMNMLRLIASSPHPYFIVLTVLTRSVPGLESDR